MAEVPTPFSQDEGLGWGWEGQEQEHSPAALAVWFKGSGRRSASFPCAAGGKLRNLPRGLVSRSGFPKWWLGNPLVCCNLVSDGSWVGPSHLSWHLVGLKLETPLEALQAAEGFHRVQKQPESFFRLRESDLQLLP